MLPPSRLGDAAGTTGIVAHQSEVQLLATPSPGKIYPLDSSVLD